MVEATNAFACARNDEHLDDKRLLSREASTNSNPQHLSLWYKRTFDTVKRLQNVFRGSLSRYERQECNNTVPHESIEKMLSGLLGRHYSDRNRYNVIKTNQ